VETRLANLLLCGAGAGLFLEDGTDNGQLARDAVAAVRGRATRLDSLPNFPCKPVVARSHDRRRGGANGHTGGGAGPVEVRLLDTLRHWMVSIGRWSRRDGLASNHTAAHVIRMTARVVFGITPPAKALLSGLGEADALALTEAATPVVLNAWNMMVVDTAHVVTLIDTLHAKATAKARSAARRTSTTGC
jgi:hypothetical protein